MSCAMRSAQADAVQLLAKGPIPPSSELTRTEVWPGPRIAVRALALRCRLGNIKYRNAKAQSSYSVVYRSL